MKRFFAVCLCALTLIAASSCTTPSNGPETEIGIWYSTFFSYEEPGSEDNKLDTWNAWDLKYKPLLPDGSFGYYDSGDEEVIKFHLKMLSEAQIDFIIMDQTNHIDVDNGYINERSLKVAQTIKEYNDTADRPVKYCSAIGAIQWSKKPEAIEEEAKILWERYNSQEFGTEDYHYYYEGKPLLIVYGNDGEKMWNEYTGDKTYGSKFTIRWAGNDNTPGYWGWAYTTGPKWHHETVVVMPGWHNRAGNPPVYRDGDETYRKFWDNIMEQESRPRIIVINSFNEYGECTSILPAQTPGIKGMGAKREQWLNAAGEEDPWLYWNLTKEYITAFKASGKPLASGEVESEVSQ
ncbi:MAG: hypothetical protein E7486_07475 [Ruminococcaceae bacterium]|nr:hypothetical protein [Oscillospiraceae bacterium]